MIKGEKKQKFNEFSLNLNFGKRNGEMKGFEKGKVSPALHIKEKPGF